MEYRGKQCRVMQGIDSQWKWSVDGIEGYTEPRSMTKSGIDADATRIAAAAGRQQDRQEPLRKAN
jgi:hypothetical protein